MDDGDREVTVCAACLTASCWHGVFMCDASKGADIKRMKASELVALAREHPDNFSRKRLLEVCGDEEG